jgi:hypothetical protein
MPSVDAFSAKELSDTIINHSDITWEDLSKGDILSIVTLPSTVTAKVVDVQLTEDWDSYGDAVGSGYVVFELGDGDSVKNFKIEGYQSSYSGWTWRESYITEVSPSPKTVVIWEAI